MKPEKDKKTGKWLIQYRYRDWTGKLRKSMKRGFNTRREAEEWLRNFLLKQQSDFDMRFKDFADLYFKDMEARLREHTMINKHYIMDDKVLPYFGKKKMNEITPADIRKWQTELINKGYSKTYLKTINKRESWLAFQILFWTGMRIGELLALEINDVNLQTRVISVTKSYQRLRGKDIITPPKTPKSIRDITIPEFLVEDIRDYLDDRYEPEPDEPLLPITKTFLEKEFQRGINASGVKKIRIHDLRHSHASLLIELGFSPKEIADRLGHEKIETTLNTYSHLYPNKQEKIAERLNRFGREEDNDEL